VKKKIKKVEKTDKMIPKLQKDVFAEKENKFDFGGLPKMDLKKNLGCG
jgi:hypothetical protein